MITAKNKQRVTEICFSERYKDQMAMSVARPSEGRSQYHILVLQVVHFISHHSEMDLEHHTGAYATAGC